MTFHVRKASLSGAAAPTAVTPEFIGQIYVNTLGPDYYISDGVSEGDWIAVGEPVQHAINGALHNGVDGATENHLASFTDDGFPQDSGIRAADLIIKNADMPIKVFAQDGEPTLDGTLTIAIWKDTNDSNRCYLITKRGTADQVAVELT